MAEGLTIDLDPGGGGGLDRPLRPTENYDDEEPSKRVRVVEAIRRVRYGTAGQDAYRGVFPGEEQKSVHKRTDNARVTGEIALEAFITGEQSAN